MPMFGAASRRVGWLEKNLGFVTLKTTVDRGWDAFGLVDGWVEEFQDASDVETLGGATYDASGKYLHNPGGYSPNILTPSMVASANVTPYPSAGGYPVSGPINGIAESTGGNCWYSDDPAWPKWWQVDLGAGGEKAATKLRIMPVQGAPFAGSNARFRDFSLKASNDGVSWVTLTSGQGPNAAGWQEYAFSNLLAYRYFRIEMTSTWHTYDVGLAEVELMTDAAPADIDVVSKGIASDGDAGQIRAIVRYQSIDGAAMGGNGALDVSANGGASWHEVPLSKDGAFDGASVLYSGMVGVTPGAIVKWRWRTSGARAQKLHGIWLQWS